MKHTTLWLTAAALLATVSCSKNSAEYPASSGNAVPILIGGTTAEVESKAAVNAGEKFTAQVLGSLASKGYAAIYKDANGNSVNQAVEFAATTGTGAFSPVVHYPADGAALYMTGYAPASGTLANGKVTFTIPAAADADIMAAVEVSGSKSDKTGKTLAFQHKMTQVLFKVKAETAEAAATWGKLKNITITGQPASVTLDLTQDGFPITAAGSSSSYVAFDGATTPQALTTAPVDAGNSLILPPATTAQLAFSFQTENSGSTPIAKTIAVVASNPVNGTSITLLPGQKNIITLTFKAAEIAVSATVGAWANGSTSEVPIE